MLSGGVSGGVWTGSLASLALFQIAFEDGDHLFDLLLSLLGRDVLGADVFAQLPFEHDRHQTIDSAANGRDLLKDCGALFFDARGEHAFERLSLALDAAGTCQETLLTFDGVGHGEQV